ncbi:hypothetical protein QR680_002384 [Steinernema hermaphroditum]|uniref:Uncharacterized protein n=1 Tax=Steinernema hermaphroditum TaxID=289476 RepID=A0AA39H498_9BILA|nr:hypothetical protein QR680_002384 [Steinernema hermaphroditum]
MNKLLVLLLLSITLGATVPNDQFCRKACTRKASFYYYSGNVLTTLRCSNMNDCAGCCEAFGLSRNLIETVGFREANGPACICCSRLC